jgi:hypothetical protein
MTALRRALAPLAQPTCPLEKASSAQTLSGRAALEADVMYSQITSDGMVRHPSFKGLVNLSA